MELEMLIGPCRRRGGGGSSRRCMYVRPISSVASKRCMLQSLQLRTLRMVLQAAQPHGSGLAFQRVSIMVALIVTHGLLLSIIHSHTLSFDAAALRARRRNCGHCESAHEHLRSGVRHIRHQWSLHSTPHHPHMRI